MISKIFLLSVVALQLVHAVNMKATTSVPAAGDEPNYKDYAKVARYLVHKSDYTSLGTLSILDGIKGYPMVSIMSVADSVRGANSTGDIYLYLLHIDYITHDLKADNKLTALFSNNQDLSCTKRGLDPMEPTCSRVMITGYIAQLPVNTTEYNFAAEAFLSRHPASPRWIKRHNSILAKIEIKQIAVLDYYGGQHYVTVDDYYNANIDEFEGEQTTGHEFPTPSTPSH